MGPEKKIEEHLRDEVKALGGRAYKFVSPGNNGVPDRIVVLPGGTIAFMELKAKGKTSTALQKRQQEILAGLGCLVFRDVDSTDMVDLILKGLQEMQRLNNAIHRA